MGIWKQVIPVLTVLILVLTVLSLAGVQPATIVGGEDDSKNIFIDSDPRVGIGTLYGSIALTTDQYEAGEIVEVLSCSLILRDESTLPRASNWDIRNFEYSFAWYKNGAFDYRSGETFLFPSTHIITSFETRLNLPLTHPQYANYQTLVFGDNIEVKLQLKVTATATEGISSFGVSNWGRFGASIINSANDPPTANIVAEPPSGDAPLTVDFIGGGSDTDGVIESYLWAFGDGVQSTTQSPTHTYDTVGTYTVTLTVMDDGGATGSTTNDIEVNPPGSTPTASISASPTTGPVPLTVQFSGSGTDGDGHITGYVWDFDDGSTSIEQDTSHSFTLSGTYNIELKVIDNDGFVGIDTIKILVSTGTGPELDTDGDGIPDTIDNDDDGDGFTDAEEISAGTDPLDPNSFPALPAFDWNIWVIILLISAFVVAIGIFMLFKGGLIGGLFAATSFLVLAAVAWIAGSGILMGG